MASCDKGSSLKAALAFTPLTSQPHWAQGSGLTPHWTNALLLSLPQPVPNRPSSGKAILLPANSWCDAHKRAKEANHNQASQPSSHTLLSHHGNVTQGKPKGPPLRTMHSSATGSGLLVNSIADCVTDAQFYRGSRDTWGILSVPTPMPTN